jgi:hypothetical protein
VDPLVIIDDAFAADRAATIEQTIALVQAAAATTLIGQGPSTVTDPHSILG